MNILKELNIDEPLNEDQLIGLEAAIGSLPKQERTVINARFRDGKSRKQIAQDMKLSYERIRQIESKAITKLRHPMWRNMITEGLHDYILNHVSRRGWSYPPTS